MANIGAEFYLELDGLTGDRAILGESITLHRDVARYRIDLPDGPNAFTFMRVGGPRVGTNQGADPRDYDPTLAVLDSGSSNLVVIRLVRIVGNVESSLSADTFDPNDADGKQEYSRVFRHLYDGVLALARDFSAWTRFEGNQYWAEPEGRYPRIVNMVSLVDIDAQRGLRISQGRAGMIRIVADENMLDLARLRRVKDALVAEQQLGVEELLLLEARYILAGEQVIQADRATLLAAIALEVMVKKVLRDVASSGQAELVELLLNNPRDWSMSAHGLFSKALAAVSPSSKSTPDKALSTRVQKLFTERNKIAHSGAMVSLDDARRHVETAFLAFEFLRDLRTSADR